MAVSNGALGSVQNVHKAWAWSRQSTRYQRSLEGNRRRQADPVVRPDPSRIFCEGVMPANHLNLATNIANFTKKHDLDGVDTVYY